MHRSIESTMRTLAAILLAVLAAGTPARGQEVADIFINEVLASNRSTPPADIGGGTPDMVEIFNASPDLVALGTASDRTSYYLSDEPVFNPDRAWRFPPGISNISPGGHLVIFCDGASAFDPESQCELHASFQIDAGGREPITLFGPEDDSGERPIVDQVWLPPLRADVSFGRFPDGAGPRPVPLEEVLDTFVFNPAGSGSPPTFGRCQEVGPCASGGGRRRRFCNGSDNGPGANLAPRVNRHDQSTNRPAEGEPVRVSVKVRDDKDPTPPNIARVEIVYTVRRGSEPAEEREPIAMSSDGIIHDDAIRDDRGAVTGGQPLDRWTLWSAEIPGQPAGTRIDFFVRVTDAEGLTDTSPGDLCEPEVGPCDREFGGPGCARDEADTTCSSRPVTGERFVACDAPFTYTSGYVPRDGLDAIVINEVVPIQDGLLEDPTEDGPCKIGECGEGDPLCCTRREDFLELHNTSASEVDLSGLWLSDRWLHPRGWQFPEGSTIPPGGYLIVWLDNDGGKCPDAARVDPPCFWECPDPTDPAMGEYHTNFALDFRGDRVFLHDTEANGFGVIHGIAFDALAETVEAAANLSLSLGPDGDRAGCFFVTAKATPGAANAPRVDEPCVEEGGDSGETRFIRGDCDGDGKVAGGVTDGIVLLNFNFTGGPAPPCLAACDANGDGKVFGQVTDAVYILTFNFLGGPPPVSPFPACGPSESPGDAALGCTTAPQACSTAP